MAAELSQVMSDAYVLKWVGQEWSMHHFTKSKIQMATSTNEILTLVVVYPSVALSEHAELLF